METRKKIAVLLLTCCFSYFLSGQVPVKPTLSPWRELDSLRTLKDPQVARMDSLHHELAFNKSKDRIILHEEYNAVRDSVYKRIKYE